MKKENEKEILTEEECAECFAEYIKTVTTTFTITLWDDNGIRVRTVIPPLVPRREIAKFIQRYAKKHPPKIQDYYEKREH